MFFVAHRVPRTAAGCAALARSGATMFEADVQLAGSTVIVSHYLPLFGVRGWVQHDNQHFRWRSGPPRDPTLADVLVRVPASCRILLDPKENDERRRHDLVEALAAELPDRSRFVVSTGRLDDLEAFRAKGFSTWRTLKTPAEFEAATSGPELPDDGASVRHTLLDPRAVERLHAKVGVIVAWTVNDAARAADLARYGVQGITTDRADVIESGVGRSPV